MCALQATAIGLVDMLHARTSEREGLLHLIPWGPLAARERGQPTQWALFSLGLRRVEMPADICDRRRRRSGGLARVCLFWLTSNQAAARPWRVHGTRREAQGCVALPC